MIDATNYEPATTPHHACAETLATAIEGTAAMAALVSSLSVTVGNAVVVGMGDIPWSNKRFSRDQLEEMGCRLFITPSEEDWLLTNEAESTALTAETYSYDLFFRRQVLAAEMEALPASTIYAWCWSQLAAMVTQAREQAAGCLLLKRFDAITSLAWNKPEEQVAQGHCLHCEFRVTAGDIES